jgi:hypothetical protein
MFSIHNYNLFSWCILIYFKIKSCIDLLGITLMITPCHLSRKEEGNNNSLEGKNDSSF